MTPWLSVVGIGEDGLDGLSPSARALVGSAEVLVGGERHLALVPGIGIERLTWQRPLSGTVEAIKARAGKRVTVLASGDPLCYGIGVTLARHFDAADMVMIPAPGAVSLAAARLSWPIAEIDVVTLHGRPLSLLAAWLRPGARLIALSEDGGTPEAVARFLAEHGFGPSTITVLEHLGGPKERRLEASAADWRHGDIADLNTIAIDCRAAPGAAWLPRVPGLPDEAYAHDGQLTKREVRAATLALLAPRPRGLLWDVGAGAGSIAIEWLRAEPTAEAIAIERDRERASRIAQNASALGVPRLRVVEGTAPGALAGLAAPDAVFLGGGLAEEGLIEACWAALNPGGTLVANAVTVEGEAVLFRHHALRGGGLSRIAIARAEPVGGFSGWRPLMPVTQWVASKR
ncbi:MAG: precorrin-6y C5,15-methyltransferase (decarboxylating) subunit CbiE [Proteobacteria bacterium]|nr:precorrin-6y C5,15-methyltransferase (decarboxylating) subunit CbiE [Pseudomonadota bacterium]